MTTPAPTAPNAQQAVERLLTADGVQPSWFTDGMLEAVPLSKLDPIIRQLTSSLGALQRIESTDKPHRFVAVFDGGTLRVAASVDSQGRFEGLLFKPGSSSASFDELKAELAKLPGRVGAIIITDGADKLALAADEPLAVGSAFKLAVLAAVREHSAAKNKWSKVVELPEQAKSLPSGMLHNWPTTSPLTVQTLASLMISISDNTATDALIQMMFVEYMGVSFYREASFALFQIGPAVADALLNTLDGKNEAVNSYFKKKGGVQQTAIKAKCGFVLGQSRGIHEALQR